jgi:hypothetical protein
LCAGAINQVWANLSRLDSELALTTWVASLADFRRAAKKTLLAIKVVVAVLADGARAADTAAAVDVGLIAVLLMIDTLGRNARERDGIARIRHAVGIGRTLQAKLAGAAV